VAALLEHQVRRWIAKTGKLLKGSMPEGRDNPYPTAKAMLRALAFDHQHNGTVRQRVYLLDVYQGMVTSIE
jgi:hypothetical protein